MKVFLDPGHGGHDSGATGNGYKESDLVLEDALAVATMLIRAGVQVRLSRSKDVYVGLSQRTTMANAWGADLFISFHINSATALSATGTETYYYRERSHALAVKMQETILKSLSLTNRGVKRKGFVVVRFPKMPAVLMEPCFISSSHDITRYMNRRGRLRVNIAKTILDYLGVKSSPKRRRYNMIQPRRVHHHIISHDDKALHIKNIHSSKTIKVVIKEYNEHGRRVSGNTARLSAGQIYSLSLGNKFGSYVLRSLAKFTSRIE